MRLPTGGREQSSLKTANEQMAKERALKLYDKIYFRHRTGLSTKTVTFADAADAWIKELKADVAAGSRKVRTVLDYEPITKHYLKPYFGDKPIDCIKASDIAQYRSWRRDYWVSGPGAKEVEYQYERNGQTIKRKMAHAAKSPSPQKINGENVVIRGIFKHARDRDWMNAAQIPAIGNVKLTRRDTKYRA